MNHLLNSQSSRPLGNFRGYLYALAISFTVIYSSSLIWVHYNPMAYEIREYPMWQHVKDMINQHNIEPAQLLVIGDSRAKAGYEPLLSEINSLNLAVGGSTPIEGYYTLSHYLENNPPPKSLVISYSPLFLTRDLYFWDRTVKYDFISLSEYLEVMREKNNYFDPGVKMDDYLWKYYLLTSMYVSSVATIIKKDRLAVNNATYSSIVESKGHSYFGLNEGDAGLNAEATIINDFVPSALINYYLDKMIQMAKKNGVKVYWYTMPFNDASCSAMSERMTNNFNAYIGEIGAKMGMSVIKKIHCLDSQYFGDQSHIYSGSGITTREIIKAIEPRSLSENR